MKEKASRVPRPSPAMVVAVIALIVAIGGTAAALPGRFTVGQKDLKKGSVGARSLGRMISPRTVIWSNDETAGDGVFREAEGQIMCPLKAPLAINPHVSGMGPRAFELQRNMIEGPLKSPRGFWYRITTDDGEAGYTLTVSCLPRR